MENSGELFPCVTTRTSGRAGCALGPKAVELTYSDLVSCLFPRGCAGSAELLRSLALFQANLRLKRSLMGCLYPGWLLAHFAPHGLDLAAPVSPAAIRPFFALVCYLLKCKLVLRLLGEGGVAVGGEGGCPSGVGEGGSPSGVGERGCPSGVEKRGYPSDVREGEPVVVGECGIVLGTVVVCESQVYFYSAGGRGCRGGEENPGFYFSVGRNSLNQGDFCMSGVKRSIFEELVLESEENQQPNTKEQFSVKKCRFPGKKLVFEQENSLTPSSAQLINKNFKQNVIFESSEFKVGYIKFFNRVKEYGFIVCEGKDIFLHKDDLVKAGSSLRDVDFPRKFINSKVKFRVIAYKGNSNIGMKAIDIQLI